MKRSFRKGIFVPVVLLLCLFAELSLFAQPVPQRDSSAVSPRVFNEQQITNFKSDSDFQYQTKAEPVVSLWDRFWFWFWNMIGRILESKNGGTAFVWGIRAIALLVIGFFIWQLTKMRASGMFSASKTGGMGYSVSEEDIHGIDFEKEIADAVAAGDHRLGVRLLYLQTLKKLSDSGLIAWRIDKTNLSYVNELKQASFYQSFRRLTSQFENNWYGHLPLDLHEYNEVSREFASLQNNLRG